MRQSRSSTGLWPSSRFKVQGSLTSSIRHHPSDIIHLFRTSPVPFNLEGAPPLSCILPPQEEENRSACRSYIKVSADHQRSGFFCALRQGQRSKDKGLKPSSKFKVQSSKVEGRARPQQVLGSLRELLMIIFTPQKIPQTEER